jgi:hypothetical protein
MVEVDTLCTELAIGWTETDVLELEADLAPYTDRLFEYLRSGEKIPSHIESSGALCAPITEFTDPYALFESAAGEVAERSFEVKEYPDYWVTTHLSTVPVVMLLLKKLVPLPKLEDLCARCTKAAGSRVGGNQYLQWNMPGYSWPMHTDHDFEGVESRVHVPLVTTPENIFVWADSIDARREDWVLSLHLERGKVYQTRVDVPHTVFNEHPTAGRLHLILDVAPPAG